MARMTPQQRRRIIEWKLEAATIPDRHDRHDRAQELFGNDPAYTVWPDGRVFAVCPYTDAEHDAQVFWHQWRLTQLGLPLR